MSKKVVVVGGGIAGLAVSLELQERAEQVPGGLEVRCLEAGDEPGGNIRTRHEDGYVCEWGPNGFLDNVPATLDLARRVGLGDRLLPADDQSEIRWIFRKGKLRKVPSGPGSFLRSGVLSWPGKLRVLREPFSRKRPEGDETVFDFAARRIGKEAARVLVGAMVTGVYAGDAKELSLRATFPKMYTMESESGGLFRAMVAKGRQARKEGKKGGGGPAGPGGHLTSFHGGLQAFPDAVAKALGPAFTPRSPVARVSRTDDQLRVEPQDGAPLDADAVVLACPSWTAAELVHSLDPELPNALDAIPSAALAVIHLGYPVGDLRERPSGFGFLVPRGEGPRILGALFSSNIFPDRSPEDRFLITVMIGGAHDPDVLALDDEGLVLAAGKDLQMAMGLDAKPDFVRVFRHPRGIPQYTVGHGDRLARIDAALARVPGLFVHGNSYRGISVNLCVEQTPAVAEEVLRHLREPGG